MRNTMKAMLATVMLFASILFAGQALAVENTLTFTHSTTLLGVSHFSSISNDVTKTLSSTTTADSGSISTTYTNDVSTSSTSLTGFGTISGTSDTIEMNNGVFTLGNSLSSQSVTEHVTSGNISSTDAGTTVTETWSGVDLGSEGGVGYSLVTDNYSSASDYTIDSGTLTSDSFSASSYFY